MSITSLANCIPKWLGLGMSQAASTAQTIEGARVTWVNTTNSAALCSQNAVAQHNHSLNQNALTSSSSLFAANVSFAATNMATTTWASPMQTAQAGSAVQVYPGPPNHIMVRDRFLALLRNIEDIRGIKGPYDDLVNEMLDTRGAFTAKGCKVRLVAFLVFMNCNGVDRHNITTLVNVATDWGVEFID